MLPSTHFHEAICDYRTYERQIERVQRRRYGLEEREVPLARLSFHRSSFARVLARTVERGEYVSEPARQKTILVEGKKRVIFNYRLTDQIVHGAVAEAIGQACSAGLSPRLYSYRQGTGSWKAVADFARYLRQHRDRHAEPKQRHLYVLRRDIDAYADSIPVGASAPVWPMLRKLLAQPALPESDWQLVEQVIRPRVEVPGQAPVLLDHGVPTGQPISCVVFNFYLAELDRRLEAVPGAFYARYSDDLLFAHPSAEVVRQTSREVGPVLEQLGLRVNEAKRLDLYLTGAGRPSADWPQATPTSAVPFMGTAVQADGSVSLGRKKTRRFLSDVSNRAARLTRSLAGASTEETGRLLCAAIQQMLTPDLAPFREASAAALLRRAVTNRRQLAQLDHWIARLVLRSLTGDGSVKAFRQIPYRKLREEWGLLSLEQARNQWGREGVA